MKIIKFLICKVALYASFVCLAALILSILVFFLTAFLAFLMYALNFDIPFMPSTDAAGKEFLARLSSFFVASLIGFVLTFITSKLASDEVSSSDEGS